MTTDDAMQDLLRAYPDGVSFDPMALRLLRQKVPLGDSEIEGLKAKMLQIDGGLWFCQEMILDDEPLLAFREQATTWLKKQGCFSVQKLLEGFREVLRHVTTPEHLAAFLRHLGFTVARWRKAGLFCFQPPPTLDARLAAISETIAEWLDEVDGTLALNEIEEAMPHLTAEALNGIRISFLPEVHEVEIGGLPCWRRAEAIPLPDDFAEQLTTAVNTLVALGEKVSVKNLQFALNLSYRIHFREEYGLQAKRTFMRVCADYYQGPDDVFPKTRPPRARTSNVSPVGKRVRRPNTRFGNLGVPIGAELVFAKDGRTTCTVLDDSNQVEYKGEAFAISKLAMRLLDASVANGFRHFSHEGENLWERRKRLEREGNTFDNQAAPRVKGRETDREIIGLEGSSLSPATWRSYRTDGRNPRVAEWVRRVDSGEDVEQIATEAGYAISTVRVMICNHRLYFKVCELNGITPEASADV